MLWASAPLHDLPSVLPHPALQACMGQVGTVAGWVEGPSGAVAKRLR